MSHYQTREEARIKWMNETFEIGVSKTPTDLGTLRIYEFESILHEELSELRQVREAEGEERLVRLADLLADIIVYTKSEACRWGIPLAEVFNIVMDSQASKLVDGKPLKSPDGNKFIKGPDYVGPEERIRECITRSIHSNHVDS